MCSRVNVLHVDNFKVCTGCVHLLAVLQSAMLVCACCATLVRQALCGVIGALAAVRAQRAAIAGRTICGQEVSLEAVITGRQVRMVAAGILVLLVAPGIAYHGMPFRCAV